jgi:hypothetical protein
VGLGETMDRLTAKDCLKDIMIQIDDRVVMWEDLSEPCNHMAELFQGPFVDHVLLPLLIGPLKC